ncbi:MAG TPA: PIN domain-containing protein [Terriglobia bacterium]|nr:PIN domain-containing protein [Terriglobia bacterium]
MSRIYWDTMLFIYWLEEHPVFAKRVDEIHHRMEDRHDQLITGAFTLGEVLAGPYRKAAVQRVDDVRRLLRNVVAEIIPFTVETADRYARIRGTLHVSPADAIHLASAAQAGTDLFLTNDRRLVGKIVPGIQFIATLDTPLF